MSGIDSVKGQIAVAQATGTEANKVTASEAMSVVRSAVAMGVSDGDILKAIKDSGLSPAEKKLLSSALVDVKSTDKAAHAISAKEDAIITSSLKWEGSATGSYSLQGIVGKDSVEMKLVNASGTMDKEARATMFDTSLAQAYGLDPQALEKDGLTKELFARIKADPAVAAARKAFVESTAPLGKDSKFTIPLPQVKSPSA